MLGMLLVIRYANIKNIRSLSVSEFDQRNITQFMIQQKEIVRGVRSNRIMRVD